MNYIPQLQKFFDQSQEIDIGEEKILPETPLLSSGLLDSLNLFIIITFIEDEIGIFVEPDQVTPENFDSLNAINALLLNSKPVPAL